jgi:hypothetical protein
MSKKGTIEDQVKALSQREEKLKLQLDNDSDEMKDKAMRVGKIALIAGGVALLGYFIFNTFFGEEEEEEKPKKKRRSSSNGITSRITALALPYLEKVVSGIMEEADTEEPDQKKEKKEDKEKS